MARRAATLLLAVLLFTGAAAAQNISISNVVGNVTVGEVATGGLVRSVATGLGTAVATFAINQALQWFLDQAVAATGVAEFDDWVNWNGGGSSTLWCLANNNDIWFDPGTYFQLYGYAHWGLNYAALSAGGVAVNAPGGYQSCRRVTSAGTPRPSFANWVSGNYTNPNGSAGTPHPFAPGGLNTVFQRYYDNNKANIIAGTDPVIDFSPLPDPYDFDPTLPVGERCRSPRVWNGASCSVPLPPPPPPPPPPCPAGQTRNEITGVCSPPSVVCYPNEIFDVALNACVPVPPVCLPGEVLVAGVCQPAPPIPCPQGQHANALGQCVPNPIQCAAGEIYSAASGTCIPQPAGDCGIGGANSLFNLDKLAKCWFVAETPMSARISGIQSAYANKFPLSLAAWIPTPASPGGFDCNIVDLNLSGAFGVATAGVLIMNPCTHPVGIWMHTVGRNILLALAVASLGWAIVSRGSAA